MVTRLPNVIMLLIAAASFATAAGPLVTAKIGTDGVTEITVKPAEGGPVAYRLDLSKHFAPVAERNETIKRWESLRFGAFLCFNTNQFSGSEHCSATDPKVYDPPQLDLAGWIATFKRAGMKYAVLTTRHTSGFLLWDSPTTDLDVGSSGKKTDIVKKFVEECRRQDVVPGLYYCLWGGAGWNPAANARAVILAQLHELATRYGTIPYFWIDMGYWRPGNLTIQEIYDALKSEQPDAVVIINQHVQDGRKIRYFPTDAVNGELTLPPAEGHDPHRTINGKTYYLPFEFCTVSQGRGGGDKPLVAPLSVRRDATEKNCWFTYGAGRGFPPGRPLDAESLCRHIKEAYRRGAANVLLAAAPDYTGRMRPADVEQLVRVGHMLSDSCKK